MTRTRVYLTVDVECAEERGAAGRALPAQGYDLRVWGRFANQRRELGIGLVLRELAAEGLRATFFTEALGAESFGLDGLREVVAALRGAGHDVQLHAHPVQRCARYRSLGRAAAPDDLAAYALDEQIALLGDAIALLGDAGVPRHEIRAFRAGNYGASNATWAALAAVGLRVSSSYNPSYTHRCRIAFPGARPGLFRAEHGVFELPITTFIEPGIEPGGRGHRHLQITAVSLAELTHCLWQARRLGIPEVTIVTHSFEFAHVDSIERRRGRVNTVNLRRLRGLCRFLRRHDAAFEVDTVGALAARLDAGDGARPAAASVSAWPRGRRRDRARRLVEQAWKRLEARLPIAAPIAEESR